MAPPLAECDEDDADATLLNQHVTNVTPVYEPPASSFYENIWENMVDPEVTQEAFGSSWNADMNFAKWLIFANKEAVKCALTIYAAKHNRNIMTSRSTKSRLFVKCVDESCMWYVGAVAKPKYGLWIVTSYRGPHNCIPLATALNGRMMDCNFLEKNLFHCCKKNTRQQFITSLILLKGSILGITFLTIRYGLRNNELLQRYSRIGKSLTKG